MKFPSPEMSARLESQQNIWFGSMRPDGRPHLSPVWFVWHEEKIYVGIDPKSVKARNIRQNPQVVLALEDGSHPVICEGAAHVVQPPLTEGLLAAFYTKYEWDLHREEQYNLVIEVSPQNWLSW